MKRLLFLLVLFSSLAMGQGENAVWLMGNQGLPYDKGKMTFDSSSYIYNKEFRKMAFRGTEATISDRNGNFLMSSNGVWIANATNDTMLNGGGLNPGTEVNSNPNGLLLDFANIFLPFNSDTNKYFLFHHTVEFDGISYLANQLFLTKIDLALDSGKGGVVSKNDTVFSDSLNWGIGACKHANGRDWWVVMQKHNSDIVYVVLVTPDGIKQVNSQYLNVPYAWYNSTNLAFSLNGELFSYVRYYPPTKESTLQLLDFDRCNGMFSNPRVINLTSNSFVWGNSFSPSGQYLYANTSTNLFQINVNTLQVDTVATYDGYCYQYNPNNFLCTTFFNEYLAANGKIYITSGSTVFHIHEMNYPDSAGAACDLQQHSIFLDMFNFRAVPNHPNYHLGPVIGSVCDSLSVGQEEYYSQIQNFQISPNPLKDGPLQIMYLLPQNQSGIFEVYDLNGKIIYQQKLPPWSSMQSISLPNLRAGLYSCVIRSGGSVVSRKLLKI
jgi:Secretion system C-terminal sorting domain